MRGSDERSGTLFSNVDLEARVHIEARRLGLRSYEGMQQGDRLRDQRQEGGLPEASLLCGGLQRHYGSERAGDHSSAALTGGLKIRAVREALEATFQAGSPLAQMGRAGSALGETLQG